MSNVIEYLFFASINMSIGFSFVLLLAGIFKRKLGFGWKRMAWIVVIVFSMIPIQTDSINIIQLVESIQTTVLETNKPSSGTVIKTKDENNSGFYGEEVVPYEKSNESEKRVISFKNFFEEQKLIILFIWGAGVLFFGSRLLYGKIKIGKMLSCGLINNTLEKNVNIVGQHIEYTRKISVLECETLKSPIVAGTIHPKIYFPYKYEEEFSQLEFENIIKHEIYHLKSFDILDKFFLNVVRMIFWFNPLVHMIVNIAFKDLEMACDSKVVSGMSNDEIKEYCNSIIKAIPISGSYGLPFKNKTSVLKKRIDNCFERRSESMKAKIGIVVTIFVVVCASSFAVWNSGLAGNRDAKEAAKVESGTSVTEGSTATVQEPQEIVVEIKFRENFDKEDVIDDFIAKKIEGSKLKVIMFNEYGEKYYTKEVICRNGQYECNGESYKYFLRVTGRNLNAAHNGGLLILCNRKISYEEYWSHVYDSNHNPDEWIKHEVIGDYVYY